MSILLDMAEALIRHVTLPPTSVTFEPTSLCNLHCTACRRWYWDSPNKGNLSLKMYREALDNIGWIPTAIFIGPDGEPLCNPEFPQIIEYNSSKGIHSIFTTNGMLLTPKLVSFFKERKVSRITISLDSPNPVEYEILRKGADFNRVVEACRLVSNSDIYLQINMIVFEDNVDEVLEYAKLAKKVGASKVYYIRPQYTREFNTNLDPEITPKRVQLFKQVEAYLKTNKIAWADPLGLGTYFRPCMFPFTSPWVTLAGEIKPCCFIFGNHTEILDGYSYEMSGDKYTLGNIYKDNFKKIWYGKNFNELRQFIKKTEYKRGQVIETKQLVELKKYPLSNCRFEQCRACLWRWSAAC